jgi:chromosome segregation ATPase
MPASAETQQLITKLASGVETLTQAVEALRQAVKETSEKQTQTLLQLHETKTDCEHIEGELAHIARTVRDGNGQPSLLSRVTTLEEQTKTAKESIDELEKRYDVTVLTRGQIIAGVIGMVLTALLALGAILAQLMR